MSDLDTVTPSVEREVTALGYELVDITLLKRDGNLNLTVYIHKPGGIDLDDCEKVHRVLDVLLDDIDFTHNEPYILNVSSPGLDRKIVTQRDYMRALGTEIELILHQPVERKKRMVGILLSADEEQIQIQAINKKITVPLVSVKEARPYIRF